MNRVFQMWLSYGCYFSQNQTALPAAVQLKAMSHALDNQEQVEFKGEAPIRLCQSTRSLYQIHLGHPSCIAISIYANP